MTRVFEPYVTTKPRGTGLGLAIVKKIIDEHNGAIKVENRPGRGASVSVTLPLQPESAKDKLDVSDTGRRRRNRHPRAAVGDPRRRGPHGAAGGKRSARARAARSRTPRSGAARHLDARYRRHYPAQGMGGERPAHHAGGHDVRARHHRNRGGGDAHRRDRFPGKTDCAAETARHGEARAAERAGGQPQAGLTLLSLGRSPVLAELRKRLRR